jgi:hypothetical protein
VSNENKSNWIRSGSSCDERWLRTQRNLRETQYLTRYHRRQVYVDRAFRSPVRRV